MHWYDLLALVVALFVFVAPHLVWIIAIIWAYLAINKLIDRM